MLLENIGDEILKYQVQYSCDKTRVWVHCSTGETVGRFDVRYGMDIHHTIAEQQKNGGVQCLHCTHEKPKISDRERFIALAKTLWNVRINKKNLPLSK